MSTGTYDENGEWQGEQKEYKEVEKIVHKEVIKEVTVGVSEEELSKVRGRVGIDRCASWKLDAIEQTQSRGRRHVDGVGGGGEIRCPQHRRERHECHCMLFLPEEHGFAGDSDEIGLAEVEELTANFKPPPQ